MRVAHDHHHDHDHAHGHGGHSHAPKDFGVAFAFGAGLNAAFVLFEAVLGFASHSLALLSDAGHNLGDVLALLLAWGANRLVKARPAGRRARSSKGASRWPWQKSSVRDVLNTGA